MQQKQPITSGMNRRQAQSGQAIILMALAMIGLIGMLGLAIDGGGMFFLQRDAQNATDAAVLAATYALCAGGDQASVENAGYEAAAANGFRNEGDRTVVVSNPPLHGEKAADSGATDRFNYVEVNITANKPAYFIQVVYQGPLQITTHAVGSCTPPFDASKVGAVFGISNSCQNTVNWTGASGYIEGGMFSNNEIKIGGGGQSNTVVGSVAAASNVTPATGDGKTSYSPDPVFPVPARDDPFAAIFQFNEFAPNGNIVNQLKHVSGYLYTVILPGTNPGDLGYGVDYKSNGSWTPTGRTLEGMYYVDGDVYLGSNGTNAIGPNGITIAATGKISGSKLTGLHYYAYPGSTGLLFFSNLDGDCNGANSNAIDVSGNETQWHGIVYAPLCGAKISGSSLSLFGAIVAQSVATSGSDLRLVADPSIIPPRPAIVQIAE